MGPVDPLTQRPREHHAMYKMKAGMYENAFTIDDLQRAPQAQSRRCSSKWRT